MTLSLVRDAAGTVGAVSVPTYRLRVVRGPNRRQERKLSKRRVLIGSSVDADFPLTDPTVSAVHCELTLDDAGLKVRDLGSKNGVRIGALRVGEAWLEPEVELILGETVVRVESSDEREEKPIARRSSMGRLRGGSLPMRELYQQLESAAKTEAPVLLLGETGTGKELATEAVVAHSARKDGPLVVLDCTQLTPELAESALFGHEKGAFTGAVATQPGIFERAHTGTVFLDEVGELPIELQPRLLGVLERKQVQRVGGGAPITVDVRVIAATHRDLPQAVNRGTFRADLYYRLAAVEVHLPPLRLRTDDIPELIAHFLEEMPGAPRLSPTVIDALCRADYPGNVRELRNAVERAVLGLGPLSAPASTAMPQLTLDEPFRLQKDRHVRAFETAYITKLMDACKGNVAEAARRSGMNRVHLHEVIRRLGL